MQLPYVRSHLLRLEQLLGVAHRVSSDLQHVLLVTDSLAGRAADKWLGHNFRKSARWWWSLSRTSEVIKGILGQYPKKLLDRSAGRRLEGHQRSLSQRGCTNCCEGQEIPVLNDRRAVTLAFEESAAQFENLHWFLNELCLEIAQDK